MDVLAVVGGALVVIAILIDVFQTIVLPRPIVRSRIGIARGLVYVTWRAWRWMRCWSAWPASAWSRPTAGSAPIPPACWARSGR